MTSSPERFARVAEVFEAVRRLPEDERERAVEAACGSDVELAEEVRSLLRHATDPGDAGDPLSDEALQAARARLSRVVSGEPTGVEERAGLPERIGPYTVLRRLGAGGMGVVYEAVQENPRRTIAVKLLHPTLLVPSVLHRFAREAEVLGRLNHPSIAAIHDAATCDLGHGEQPFLAMELVEGRPVTRYADEQRLGVAERTRLVVAIAEAVHYAHSRGVVHRDLKPDNVLVDATGLPRILDFGIAHVVELEGTRATLATRTGEVLGTLAYMSPEQAAGTGGSHEPATDVYALGCLAYELLAGRAPLELRGDSLLSAVQTIAETEPAPLRRAAPRVSADLALVVHTALQKEPERRYGSALELAEDLRRALLDEPVRARPPSVPYRLGKFARRNRYVVGGVAVAFLGLAVALASALAINEGGDDAAYFESKIAIARFFADNFLTEAVALTDAVTTGAARVARIDPELLSA